MTFPVLPGTPAGAPSWEDRVVPGVYTSPSGTRIEFLSENVSRSTDTRRTPFQFPGVDGVYVQENGIGPRSYPLRCFFTGATCDLEATAFESALFEKGRGKLQHPFYGTFECVPVGKIKRRDDLKTAANQAIVEVDFWPSLRAVYPTSQAEPESEITAALAGFDAEAAQAFADLADLDSIVNQAGILETMRAILNEISGVLESVAEATASVNREFRDAVSVLNLGMDVFVGQPLLLAQQFLNLTTLPARALAGIESRLDGYGLLLDRMIASNAGNPALSILPGTSLSERLILVANDFHGVDLEALAAVSGSVTSVLDHTFTTRPEAINAAQEIFGQFDIAVAWRDAAFTTLAPVGTDQLDSGASIQALQDAVALTAGFLVEVSFSLVPERILVLDRARTIIDICGQVYGTTADEKLNAIIDNNDLTGSEILELPRGTEIRYYTEVA